MTRHLRAATVAVAFLLSTVLASSTTSAEPRREERTIRERTASVFLNACPQIWTAIRSVWDKEGSSLDPFGNTKPNTTVPPTLSGTGTSSDQ